MNRPIIKLGTWDGKPIEWYVLKEENFGKLLFSRLALFSLNLGWNGTFGTWRDSSLRFYLNRGFYNKAFTENEKKIIINSFLKDPEGTKDNVFLLSYEEANTLMTQAERKCGNGTNCNGHSCSSNCYQYSGVHGTCVYLRTPHNTYSMQSIQPDGSIGYDNDWKSIRPAMWIREK